MSYALLYKARVIWLPTGLGAVSPQLITGPGMLGAPAQSLDFFNAVTGTTAAVTPTVSAGTQLPPNSTTFTASDVNNLVAAMAADLAAQMSASAILTRVQNFSTGTG